MLVRSLRGSFIDSFSSAKKRCNTSQGFGAFFGQSCDRDRFLFPFISEFLSFFSLFLDFIAISDCVFNNKNHYVLGHTGYQIIITILVISTLNANLRVATRVYDVEGGAIFSKNSTFVFFDGAAWTLRLRSPSPIMAPEEMYVTWETILGQQLVQLKLFLFLSRSFFVVILVNAGGNVRTV